MSLVLYIEDARECLGRAQGLQGERRTLECLGGKQSTGAKCDDARGVWMLCYVEYGEMYVCII